MLTTRSIIQTTRTLNPEDEKIFSTYQAEYNKGKTHGNLVSHYGNSAYLDRPQVLTTNKFVKPFVTPSYQNITSEAFMANKVTDNYSNNYKSSEDNFLKRPIHTAPIRTKLDQYFNTKNSPIAKVDRVSAYEEDYLNKRVNDHFVSKKLLKTETINLRDTIVSLIFFRYLK
jgi:hypothetical protein